MNKFKKGILITLITFSSLFLVSCKGSNEINTLGIVISLGFDLEGEEVIITSEVINPIGLAPSQKSGGAEEPTKFVMSRGKTILDAIANARLTFDRALYSPHVHTIIFGEDVIKEGLDEYIDMLSRNNQIRESTILMIAKDAKAYEVMGIGSGLSTSPGRYMYEITQGSDLTSKQRPLDINRFLKYFYRKNEGYVLGVVEKIEKKVVDKKDPKKTLEVLSSEGGAVLKEEKLVGYFTGDEMMGFNFIVDEFEGGIISFEIPEFIVGKENIESSREKPYSSFQVFKNRTKLDIKLKEDKLHLYINLKLRGSIKANQEEIDFNDPIVINELEKSIGKSIKKSISTTLEKAQKEFEVDIFSIGELLHRSYPELWKEIQDDWTEVFKDLEYTIIVDTNINDIGFTNTTKRIRKGIYEK